MLVQWLSRHHPTGIGSSTIRQYPLVYFRGIGSNSGGNMPETSRLRQALNRAVGGVRESATRIADSLRRARAARRAVRAARKRSRGR